MFRNVSKRRRSVRVTAKSSVSAVALELKSQRPEGTSIKSRRATLLSGSALAVGGILYMLAGSSNPAYAAAGCTSTVAPDTVLCNVSHATDNTTVNNAAVTTISRQWNFGDAAGLNTTVNPGVVITVFGLEVNEQSLAGPHNVSLLAGAAISSTAAGIDGLRVSSQNGPLTLTGQGVGFASSGGGNGLAVLTQGGTANVGTVGSPILAAATGNTGVLVQTTSGTENIFWGGSNVTVLNAAGDGFRLLSGTGTINANITSTTVNGSGAGNNNFGINAQTAGAGNIIINSTSNNYGAAGAATSLAVGIAAQNNTGSVSISSADNIFGTFAGILAHSNTSAGNVSVSAIGPITMTAGSSFGIDARTTGAGAVTVLVNNTITGPGIGIFERSVGGAVTASVTGNGVVSAVTTGIDVVTQGTGAITVDVAGIVRANGNTAAAGISSFNFGSGLTSINVNGSVSSASDAIVAGNSGTGSIQITGAGPISGDTNADGAGNGILAGAASGLISVNVGGPITAGDDGILTFTTNGGNISITEAGNISASVGNNSGSGIQAIAAAAVATGSVSVNASGNITTGNAGGSGNFGIRAITNATTAATGTVNVTTATGKSIQSFDDGIQAQAARGNVTVLSQANITSRSGDGIDARITNAAGTGNIDVTVGGNSTIIANSAGRHGVIAVNSGTGTSKITVQNGSTIIGDAGLVQITSGGDADQPVGNNVSVTGGVGIVNEQTGATGPGHANVTIGTGSTITGDGTVAYSGPGTPVLEGTGIFDKDFGVPAAAVGGGALVTVGAGSTINGSGTTANGISGIRAEALAGNVLVKTDNGVLVQVTSVGGQNSNTGIFAAGDRPNTGSTTVAVNLGTNNTVRTRGATSNDGILAKDTSDLNRPINSTVTVTTGNGLLMEVGNNSATDGNVGIEEIGAAGGSTNFVVTTGTGNIIVHDDTAGDPPGRVTAGIWVHTAGTGSVTVTNNSNITSGNPASPGQAGTFGILTAAPSGNTTVTSNGVILAGEGIRSTSNTGNITDIITQNITATSGDGIHDETTQGNVNISVVSGVTIKAAGASGTHTEDGIEAATNSTTPGGGNITITTDVGSRVGSNPNGGRGIWAHVDGTQGAVNITTNGDVMDPANGLQGVNAEITNAANPGAVSYTATAIVWGGGSLIGPTGLGTLTTSLNGAGQGIRAFTAGTGPVTVNVNNAATAKIRSEVDHGILAFTNNTANASNVSVNLNGVVSASGVFSDGIHATTFGTGNVNVTTQANSLIGGTGTGLAPFTAPNGWPAVSIGHDGINASIQGSANVGVVGNVNVTTGTTSQIDAVHNGIQVFANAAIGPFFGNINSSLNVTTGTSSTIRAGVDGINAFLTTPFAGATFNSGSININTGTSSTITAAVGGASGHGIFGAIGNGAPLSTVNFNSGNITVNTGTNTTITALSTVSDGIHVEDDTGTTSNGKVTVNLGDNTTINAGHTGVFAQALVSSTQAVTVQMSGSGSPLHISANNGGSGIDAHTAGTGGVVINSGSAACNNTVNCKITVLNHGATGMGINGVSTGVSGGVQVNNFAVIDPPLDGIHMELTNPANPDPVAITNNANVSGDRFGIFGGTQGLGTVNITEGNIINGTTVLGGAAGIVGVSTNINNARAVTINLNGNVTANSTDPSLTFVSAATAAPYTTAADNGIGILARVAGTGDVVVHADGTGTIRSINGGAEVGIRATTTNTGNSGNVLVTSNESINAGSAAGANTNAIGIDATNPGSGSVTVQTAAGGVITTTGIGINAQISSAGTTGPVLVTVGAPITSGNIGVRATTTGTGPLSNVTVLQNGAGTIIAGTGVVAGADGILATAAIGNVSVDSAAGVTGSLRGIEATTAGSGTVTVTTQTTSNVRSTGANAAQGILATTVNGADSVTVNGTVTGATRGVQATSSGAGTVFVGGSGTVLGTGALGNGAAIFARETGVGPGTGNGVVVSGTGNATSTNDVGVDAQITNAANAANVLVDRSGNITGTTGILAKTIGTGGVTVQSGLTGGVVSGTSNLGTDAGILAQTTSGPVLVINEALVTSLNDAIVASANAGGSVTVITRAPVTGDTNGDGVGSGVAASATGGNGNVSVQNNGPVSGAIGVIAAAVGTGTVVLNSNNRITGNAGSGVVTGSINGATTININANGTSGLNTITGTGAGTSGIASSSTGTGNIGITLAAGTTVTDTLGRGITISETGTGVATVNNNGTVTGAGTAANPVIAGTLSAGLTLNNNLGGVIQAVSGNRPAALAVSTTGAGPVTANNAGLFQGNVITGTGADVFNNNAGGIWNLSGTTGIASNFGTGNDTINNNLGGIINAAGVGTIVNGIETINNTGVTNAGAAVGDTTAFNTTTAAQVVNNTGVYNVMGTLAFTGNAGSNFNNGTGLINMQTAGNATSDVVTLNTTTTGTSDLNYTYVYGPAYNFNGGANSRLNTDTFLGAPGSASDRLVFSGNSTGTTRILVNDTNTGAGSFNTTGITVVAQGGATGTTSFVVDPATPGFVPFSPLGAISKGFFLYPLLYIPGGAGTGNAYKFVGLPGQQAFQMPIAATGAQNIWDETALGWEDRMDEVRRFQRRGLMAAGQAFGGGADLAVKAAPRVAVQEPSANTGVWLKAIGSWTRRNVTSFEPGFPQLSFDNSYSQNTYGLQGGIDFGKSEVTSPTDSFALGLMGGYISSFLDFGTSTLAPLTSATHFKYTGGTVGLSATYMNGGFFADALLKADFLKLNITGLPAGFGVASTDLSVNTVGILGNIGYRIERGRYYIEPLATLSYSTTKIDDLALPAVATTVQFGTGTSFKGAIGTRFGGVITEDRQYVLETNVTAKWWNQFNGNNTVSFVNLGPTFTLNDVFTRSYAEVAFDLDWLNKTSGWSAFAKVGTKFNKDFITNTAKGGVRYSW
jgi:hypothetical protein